MNQFTFTATTRIWQMVAINLTALGLTLLGGIVFGAAPATAATLRAVRRLDEVSAGELSRDMWATFKLEFLRANIASLPVVCSAVLLVLAGPHLGTFGFALAISASMIALCFAAANLLIVAHIETDVRATLHNARMALLLSPFGHLVALMALGPWLWLIWQQPLVGVYLGLSLPAYVYSGLVLPSVSAGFPAPLKPIPPQEALT